ncbi:hypothetical protein [Lacticaseibacillus sp. N501-2]|uniref:hypothetical protein n=1 Tax=Lacticaseibacillus salsurae TaxID=3367729 RepID=UPI0038B23CF7
MLKVIDLPDGKQIPLKSNAATTVLYKAQFGTDFFADMIKLSKVFGSLGEGDTVDFSKVDYSDIAQLDFSILYQVTWMFAKIADDSIPEMTKWLSGFEEFPLGDVMNVISEMLASLFSSTKNLKAPTKQMKK